MAIALAKSFVVSVFPVPIQQHWLHHDDDVNKKLNPEKNSLNGKVHQLCLSEN